MIEYSLNIYKHKGGLGDWYTLDKREDGEKVLIKYLKEDVSKLLLEERGWDISWVLRQLVTKHKHREGIKEVKQALL